MPDLRFYGCRPEPMMSYLKSLGILRLVSEQADPDVCAYWKDDIFCLVSQLNNSALTNFFLNDYSPSPIVTPWNGGSGFFEGDRSEGINAILQSKNVRFKDYRDTIQEILNWKEMPCPNKPLKESRDILIEIADHSKGKNKQRLLELLNNTNEALSASADLLKANPWDLSFQQLKDETTNLKKELKHKKNIKPIINLAIRSAKNLRTEVNKRIREKYKDHLVGICRNKLNDRAVEWVDAAIVIGQDGQLGHLPILGTGGNEGRLDYGNTFMYALRAIFFSGLSLENMKELLCNALFNTRTNHLIIAPVGQHNPGRAGGFNQGSEIETKDFPSNPWDFVLSMEGTLAWAGNLSRRNARANKSFLSMGSIGRGRVTSPFTFSNLSVGYASSTDSDKIVSRAEIWAPVWKRPSSYRELRQFLGEGRAEISRRPARDTLEFAEAVTSLGVDRGLSEFVRFSLIKRRGDNPSCR